MNFILTNSSRSFKNSSVIETRLSDFHRMIVTVTKMSFQKFRLRVINNRDYKYFYHIRYRNDLKKEISNYYLQFNGSRFSSFLFMQNNFRYINISKAEVCTSQSYAIYDE